MQKYLDATRNLTQSFKSFQIKQIPRGENTKADALSKLASASLDHVTKKVLIEVLEERSIVTPPNQNGGNIRGWMTSRSITTIEYCKESNTTITYIMKMYVVALYIIAKEYYNEMINVQ
uniref:RNase H type-1 domain-containing protein n=1 Tax=Lactuca sativa TaxID=4236 RepID=A0A9R1WT32_LACSA|nr:hypothetical protein LSAT_V11C100041710 [Lactuca sativa]